MRILGLDPGSITTGFGIIDCHNNKSSYVVSGCMRLDKLTWPDRLGKLYSNVNDIITDFTPDCVALEQVFVAKNVSSALKLGQVRGALMVAVSLNNLNFAEYTARAVKKAVVGYGNAAKEQMQHMVQQVLQLDAMPGQDASDALGVALCHANQVDILLRAN